MKTKKLTRLALVFGLSMAITIIITITAQAQGGPPCGYLTHIPCPTPSVANQFAQSPCDPTGNTLCYLDPTVGPQYMISYVVNRESNMAVDGETDPFCCYYVCPGCPGTQNGAGMSWVPANDWWFGTWNWAATSPNGCTKY